MTERTATPVYQDMRSRHSDLWGRADGYLYGKDETLSALKSFAADWGGATL